MNRREILASLLALPCSTSLANIAGLGEDLLFHLKVELNHRACMLELMGFSLRKIDDKSQQLKDEIAAYVDRMLEVLSTPPSFSLRNIEMGYVASVVSNASERQLDAVGCFLRTLLILAESKPFQFPIYRDKTEKKASEAPRFYLEPAQDRVHCFNVPATDQLDFLARENPQLAQQLVDRCSTIPDGTMDKVLDAWQLETPDSPQRIHRELLQGWVARLREGRAHDHSPSKTQEPL